MCARLFLVLNIYSLVCVVENGRVKRVVGGNYVSCGTQPRVASLRNATTDQHLCGATLLSPHFAVTAAHCVTHSADHYELLLNNYCVKDGDVPRIEVKEIIPNVQYDKYDFSVSVLMNHLMLPYSPRLAGGYSRAHDIAIIRISHYFDDTAWLNQSMLPKSTWGLSGECTVFGYGYTDPLIERTTEVLQAGRMSVVSLDECWAKLGPHVAPVADAGMMCAMGAGVDACQGDSGAPLICSGVVQAVSSYGMSCAVPGLPGVFASLAPHLEWIHSVLNST